MLLSDWIDSVSRRVHLFLIRRCFLNEQFHPVKEFVGVGLRSNNLSSVFFADLDFCTRSNIKTFAYLPWENNSSLGIDLSHVLACVEIYYNHLGQDADSSPITETVGSNSTPSKPIIDIFCVV